MKKIILASAFLLTLFISLKAEAFSDIKKGMYYEEAVEWAANERIISGYSDNTFKPSATVTFDQFIKMYANSFPFETNEAKTYEEFYKALLEYNIGINYKPKYITRGDVAVLWIYVKSLDTFCLSFFLGQHPEWIVSHPK